MVKVAIPCAWRVFYPILLRFLGHFFMPALEALDSSLQPKLTQRLEMKANLNWICVPDMPPS